MDVDELALLIILSWSMFFQEKALQSYIYCEVALSGELAVVCSEKYVKQHGW